MRLGAKLALLTGSATAAVAVASGVASYVFVTGMHLRDAYPIPTFEWWIYATNMPADWPQTLRQNVGLWLKISGAIGLAVVALPAAALAYRKRKVSVRTKLWTKQPRPIERGNSDNHGHASWMTNAEAMVRFSGPDPVFGGIVIGEAYRVDQDSVAGVRFSPGDSRTWGRGGKASLLIDPCEEGAGHSLTIAGPGGFKSVSAISTLLYWKGSAVVLDPSSELGPMVDDFKRNTGHKVVQLTVGGTEGFNVLEWIDVHSTLAETNVNAVVNWAFGEQAPNGGQSEEQRFFQMWGKSLAACILAHMLWDETIPKEQKTVRRWRAGIATPQSDMRELLKRIHAKSSSAMAKQLAGSLMQVVDETFSGIYANANGGTNWLSVPAYADMLSASSFSAADIVAGNTTVFLQIPLKTLMETPGVARVVIGSLLNQVYEADGKIGPFDRNGNPAGRVLFLLDEVFQLGYMKSLTIARDAGRKSRITLALIYQSVAQLDQQWTKEGRRAWYDGVAWRSYGSVQDMDTAKELSEACGNYAVVAISEGDNQGRSGRPMEIGSRSKGSNESWHEIRRSLILPEEITQDARADEIFVIARGCKPIRCGRAIYFRRPEMVPLVQTSRFSTVQHKEEKHHAVV